MKIKKVLSLIFIIMVLISLFACKQIEKDKEAYVYNGATKINTDGRNFEFTLEDIPENMVEETVVNEFIYSISGDYKSLSNILANTETFNILIENEKSSYKEGIYIQSYTIREISILSENEYNQEKLENDEQNPLYYYEWKEIVEKHDLIEYEIVNVEFTQKYPDNVIELGPQWGNGTFNRSFIVGKSSKGNIYKIYGLGEVY